MAALERFFGKRRGLLRLTFFYKAVDGCCFCILTGGRASFGLIQTFVIVGITAIDKFAVSCVFTHWPLTKIVLIYFVLQ